MSGPMMRYGTPYPETQFDHASADVVLKAIAETRRRTIQAFVGQVMRAVLKLSTQDGIDDGYRRAMSDVTIAMQNVMVEQTRDAGPLGGDGEHCNRRLAR